VQRRLQGGIIASQDLSRAANGKKHLGKQRDFAWLPVFCSFFLFRSLELLLPGA